MRAYMPSWLQPYFTLEGRLGRAQFWLVYAVTLVTPAIIAIVVLPLMIVMELIGVSEGFRYIAVSPIVLPAIVVVNVAAFCTAVRRLHDRGKSGLWLLFFFGLPISHALFGLGNLSLLFPIAQLVAGLWFLAECGGLAGSPGVNAYGPPPGYAHVFDPAATEAMVRTESRREPSIAPARPVPSRPSALRTVAAGGGFGRRGRG